MQAVSREQRALCVGAQFVKEYYTKMHKDPITTRDMYSQSSRMTRCGLKGHAPGIYVGKQNIEIYLERSAVRISPHLFTVEELQCVPMEGNEIKVITEGCATANGSPLYGFKQTFTLRENLSKPHSAQYYIATNDTVLREPAPRPPAPAPAASPQRQPAPSSPRGVVQKPQAEPEQQGPRNVPQCADSGETREVLPWTRKQLKDTFARHGHQGRACALDIQCMLTELGYRASPDTLDTLMWAVSADGDETIGFKGFRSMLQQGLSSQILVPVPRRKGGRMPVQCGQVQGHPAPARPTSKCGMPRKQKGDLAMRSPAPQQQQQGASPALAAAAKGGHIKPRSAATSLQKSRGDPTPPASHHSPRQPQLRRGLRPRLRAALQPQLAAAEDLEPACGHDTLDDRRALRTVLPSTPTAPPSPDVPRSAVSAVASASAAGLPTRQGTSTASAAESTPAASAMTPCCGGRRDSSTPAAASPDCDLVTAKPPFAPSAEGALFPAACRCDSCARSFYSEFGLPQTAARSSIWAGFNREYAKHADDPHEQRRLRSAYRTLTNPASRQAYDWCILAGCSTYGCAPPTVDDLSRFQLDAVTIGISPGSRIGLSWCRAPSRCPTFSLRAVHPGTPAEAAGADRFAGRSLLFCGDYNALDATKEDLVRLMAGRQAVTLTFI